MYNAVNSGSNIVIKNKRRPNAQVKIELLDTKEQKKAHKEHKMKTKVISDTQPNWEETFDMFSINLFSLLFSFVFN